MPLTQGIARANRRLTNPIFRRFAGRIPPFAIIEHTGRHSGRSYRTPIMAFPSVDGDGFVVALTYGQDVDWLHNIQAQGGGTMVYRQQRVTLTDPRLVPGDSVSAALPRVVRFILRITNVTDYLMLRRSSSAL
jgi:deazaflavin-dependent oxidoreductase (nitroreductase family)